jgi:uncharacterized membrane protein
MRRLQGDRAHAEDERMATRPITSLFVPAGYGWLAGMRNLAAPAAASLWLARNGRARGRAARALASPLARWALPVLAASELGVDKLRRAPDRTQPAILLTRLASGALAGAVVCQALGGRTSARTGAVLGAAFALLSSVVNLRLRRAASARLGTSAWRAGVGEDVLALGLGAALASA